MCCSVSFFLRISNDNWLHEFDTSSTDTREQLPIGQQRSDVSGFCSEVLFRSAGSSFIDKPKNLDSNKKKRKNYSGFIDSDNLGNMNSATKVSSLREVAQRNSKVRMNFHELIFDTNSFVGLCLQVGEIFTQAG